MSAPTSHDPLVVNTKDGVTWIRRAVTGEGRGLYAVTDSCRCPEYLMATLAELAEHGIVGSADVLPAPVDPGPEALTTEQLVAKMCDALNGHECPPPDESPMGTVTRFAVRLMEAERQVAELDALELGDLDGRRSACCGKPNHPTWLRKTDDSRACPWCVMELQSESLVARTHQLVHYQEIERNFWGNQRADESRAAVANLRIVELNRERDGLMARIAELEAERHVTNEALSDAAEQLRADRDRIAELEAEQAPGDTYPLAMPWAKLMDHEDLVDFLDELAASAITHASGAVALAEVEATCGRWRVIAEAQYGHNTAPGPDALTAAFVPVQALREDEPAAKCRCDEPGADPYSCEADDCTGEFSELNPFGGGPVQGHDAKVSRTCETCGWKTSVWHVADGSAEEELHGHTVRVHGGQPVAGAS